MGNFILHCFKKDIFQMSASNINTLSESISEVSVHSFKRVDRYVGDLVSDVVSKVFQGPWTIVIN